MTLDPFSPPASDLSAPPQAEFVTPPLSFSLIFGSSVRFYGANFLMILKVTLLVLVPAHALKHWALGLLQARMSPLAGIGAEMLVETIAGSLAVATLVSAFRARVELGGELSLVDAVVEGLQTWMAVLGARLLATLYSALGLALFIVPGAVLSVRYAVVDAVATLEAHGWGGSLARSRELVRGNGWLVVSLAVVSYPVLLALQIAVGEVAKHASHLGVSIALDGLMEVTWRFTTVVWFVLYVAIKSFRARSAEPRFGAPRFGGPRR